MLLRHTDFLPQPPHIGTDDNPPFHAEQGLRTCQFGLGYICPIFALKSGMTQKPKYEVWADGPEADPATMTATDVLDALEACYCGRRPGERVLLRELAVGCETRRRIDGLLIEFRSDRRVMRTAYEVKVDRRDFEEELKCPEKRAPALKIADQFYFVTPIGLVKANEVPDDCGLIWLDGTGRPIMAKHAPVGTAVAPDWPLIQAMMRQSYRQGQQDAAKRAQPSSWDIVFDIAQSLAESAIRLADIEGVPQRAADQLKALQRDLQQHGHRDLARNVADLARWMSKEARAFQTRLSSEYPNDH